MERDSVFGNVVDFFKETWKDKPKPYKYSEHVVAKMNLKSNEAEAIRNTAIQPTKFVSNDGVVRYNKRKLTELPAFISQLRSNLAIPLSCDLIYFDYEFLHALFVVCDYTEIFEEIQKIIQLSSYAISDEAKEGLKNMQFLKLIFLQYILLYNSFPDSIAIQLLGRSLSMYGTLKYLTSFIDQSDDQSFHHCALTVPYQFVQPAGLGFIFSLDNHTKPINYCTIGGENDSFAFSLSDKVHVFNLTNIVTVGELALPKLENSDEYKTIRVYSTEIIQSNVLKLNTVEGFVLASSTFSLVSIDFDANMNFKKTFEKRLANIYQISTNHILVFFENCNFFEILNVYSGNCVLKKSHSSEIKFIICNSNTDIISVSEQFDYINVITVTADSKIIVYIVEGALRTTDRKNNFIELSTLKEIPATGIECIDCRIVTQQDEHISNSCYMLSFKDGSLIMIGLGKPYESSINVTFMKPSLNEIGDDKLQVKLKFLDTYKHDHLYLGTNSCLYLSNGGNKDRQFYKIEGHYDNGRLIDEKYFCGIFRGIIDLFLRYFNTDNKNKESTKIVRATQIDAHYADITRIFEKGKI